MRERMREKETCIKRTPLRGDLLSKATLSWSVADSRHNKYCTYIIWKGSVMCVVEFKKLKEAVLALIGSYYLLDIDYTKSHELGSAMLQHVVFKDKSSPIFLILRKYISF